LTAVAHAWGLHTTATGFRSLTGRGVQAVVDDRTYAVGGPALLRELGATVPDDLVEAAQRWSERGAAVLHLLLLEESGSPQVIGAFALEDEIRPEARQAIDQLRQQGVKKIVMITGDARAVAEAVAADLGFRPGVDEVFAEVLPADKDRAVAELQARGLIVAMVGDGVNDAPALARADVGLAIGAGTDVAIESAGVVLASSDPRGVSSVIRLSKASYRKMIQNLAWAAGGLDLPAARRIPVHHRWVERRRRDPGRLVAGAHPARRHAHRRGLPRRPAPLRRDHLQRRLLPPPRPAEAPPGTPARRDRRPARAGSDPLDALHPRHRPVPRHRRSGHGMNGTLAQVRSFNRPVRLLLINQLSINIGFYMLMPYLSGYLSGTLAMAAWTVGLILGVRNLSQQGMFLLGGSLADRIGYKPMILTGLAMRVAGFGLLGFVESLPALIVASVLIGLAGALFNPAVRAYLAAEAGERKTEAFAVFNEQGDAG
jgi:soluble P-type ATPase